MNIYIIPNNDEYINENYLIPQFFYESYNFHLSELNKNVDIKLGKIETYLDPIEIKSLKSNQIVEFFIENKVEYSIVYINRKLNIQFNN